MLHFTAIFVLFFVKLGFFGSSVGKESTHNAGDPGLIPGSRKFTGEGIDYSLQYSWLSLMVPLVKKTKQNKTKNTCNVEDLGFIPGLRRMPGERNNYLLLHSGLENSIDCIVHAFTNNQTRLSDFHSHFHGVELLN